MRHPGADDASDAVDVDLLLAEGSADDLAAALAGKSTARGSALANVEIARAARKAGVMTMITEPVLPALLVALEG